MKDFKLDNDSKITTGFLTPDDYFDTFSDKVLARIPMQEPKVISVFDNAKKWFYAAAAVIVVTTFVSYCILFLTNEQQADHAALENYISYHSTISQDEIVNFLEQEDLEIIKLEHSMRDREIQDTL